jgi:hypothetical protein
MEALAFNLSLGLSAFASIDIFNNFPNYYSTSHIENDFDPHLYSLAINLLNLSANYPILLPSFSIQFISLVVKL